MYATSPAAPDFGSMEQVLDLTDQLMLIQLLWKPAGYSFAIPCQTLNASSVPIRSGVGWSGQ